MNMIDRGFGSQNNGAGNGTSHGAGNGASNVVGTTHGGLPLRARVDVRGTMARRTSKRQELLEQAREAFALHGFYGTQISAIALRVGLRKSTFFHYFTDKGSLYEEAVCEHLREVADELDVTAAQEGTAQARLDALVDRLQRLLRADASLGRLILRELIDVPVPGIGANTALQRMIAVFATATGGDDAAHVGLRMITSLCLRHVAASQLPVPPSAPIDERSGARELAAARGEHGEQHHRAASPA